MEPLIVLAWAFFAYVLIAVAVLFFRMGQFVRRMIVVGDLQDYWAWLNDACRDALHWPGDLLIFLWQSVFGGDT